MWYIARDEIPFLFSNSIPKGEYTHVYLKSDSGCTTFWMVYIVLNSDYDR